MSPPQQPEIQIMPLSSNLTMREKKKKTNKPRLHMELEPEEAEKSLYLCTLETKLDCKSMAFVIRTVKLSDLLSSSFWSPALSRKVTYHSRPYLPLCGGCGVLGSKIFFTGGVDSSRLMSETDSPYRKDVYTFDTQSKDPHASIEKHEANMQGFKGFGLTTEICGKLYALSYRVFDNPPPFEVFDPQLGRWEGLPQPPFFTKGSKYFCDETMLAYIYSYVVAGTKIFVSNQRRPVFCFNAAHPEREWRMVPTMCNGGPFPFQYTTLVLDIHDDDADKKIMFAYTFYPWRLHVYIISLRDNQETITEIGSRSIPRLHRNYGTPAIVKLVHVGGKKACVVVTQMKTPYYRSDEHLVTVKKHHCVVIPFRYELDMTKDENNCLKLHFAPACCFEYHTNPCYPEQVQPVDCFLL